MFLVAFETFIAEGHYCRGTLLQGAVVAVEHYCQQLSTQRVVVVGVVIAGRHRCKGLSLERVINNHWRLQRDVVAGRHHCRATSLQGDIVARGRRCSRTLLQAVVNSESCRYRSGHCREALLHPGAVVAKSYLCVHTSAFNSASITPFNCLNLIQTVWFFVLYQSE